MMGTWKAKKVRKKGKQSQTPGRTKGPNCQASMLSRYMASRSRSYKDREYSRWAEMHNGKKPTRLF